MEASKGPLGPGLLQRRIHADSRFDLFLGVEKPANHRTLLLSVSRSVVEEVDELPTLKSIATLLHQHGADDRVTLELKLTDRAYLEIFSVLAADLIGTVISSDTEEAAVKAFVGRLGRWQQLMARSGPEGLGEVAQRGLYAELWFLQNLLIPAIGNLPAVTAWTGPDYAHQDFQLPGVA